ncbi:putative fungal specific transcription protein [Mycena sanguinolenta]|uniref:Putative fungal specific transcription protein n=1 Tax=Mycena sanguinolenta TaxID=230812 RepID=A0A8H6WYR9_9AGAR|nr:putative fungal specific transcription protein [Mycena sanguinolenta]
MADRNLNSDSSDPQPSNKEPLLLTGSDAASEGNVPQLQPGGPAVKLDDLGPLVVNSDGTLSRIANWAALTAAEKANTIRVLSARNKIRLANQEQDLTDSTDKVTGLS